MYTLVQATERVIFTIAGIELGAGLRIELLCTVARVNKIGADHGVRTAYWWCTASGAAKIHGKVGRVLKKAVLSPTHLLVQAKAHFTDFITLCPGSQG